MGRLRLIPYFAALIEVMLQKITFLLIAAFFTLQVRAQSIKVMSYNIHHGANRAEVNTLDQIGDFIKKSGADIVGLQEVDSVCNRSGKVDQMRRLAELTGMHYAFIRHFAYDGGAYGLGILSRFPISNPRNLRISVLPKDEKKPSLGYLVAEIQVSRKRKILFSTVHFGLNVPSRKAQSAEVLAAVTGSELPVILTGDLNATPEAAEIGFLRQFFTEAGPDTIHTFPENAPMKKIDYIMVSNRHLSKWRDTRVDGNQYSDHLPLISTIKLK